MRVRSIFMPPVLLLALIFVNQTIFPAGEDSNAEKGGSISGKIIEKESKKPIANIKLHLTLFRTVACGVSNSCCETCREKHRGGGQQ
jgi:hypothetical protein